MSLINVAVIDNGIDERKYSIGCLHFDHEIDEEQHVIRNSSYNKSAAEHGTICAGIIRKYASSALISSIKVTNTSNGRAKKEQMIKALNYCAENGIKIASVSIGTRMPFDFEEVNKCIKDITQEGLIIVAACSNCNQYTLPACSPDVIGVRCHRFYIDDMYRFNMHPFDGVDISASARHKLEGNHNHTGISNSYAAPLIAAKVHNILLQNPKLNLEEIKYELYKKAVNYDVSKYNAYACMNTDYILMDDKTNDDNEGKGVLYKTHPELKHKTEESDIPVIVVRGAEKFHIELDRLFLAEGYYPVIISQNYEGALPRCEYIPKNIDMNTFLYNVYKKYGCDVIIVEDKDERCKEGISDITINFIDKNRCEIVNEESRQSIFIEKQYENMVIDNIYETIKRILK